MSMQENKFLKIQQIVHFYGTQRVKKYLPCGDVRCRVPRYLLPGHLEQDVPADRGAGRRLVLLRMRIAAILGGGRPHDDPGALRGGGPKVRELSLVRAAGQPAGEAEKYRFFFTMMLCGNIDIDFHEKNVCSKVADFFRPIKCQPKRGKKWA